MKVEAIIVAAGLGTRLQSKVPKALVLLKGRPLINYSLKVFEDHPLIDGIVIVAAGGHLSRFIRATRAFKKVRALVAGGATRRESVKSGLKALSSQAGIVLVHDAARPFMDKATIDRLLTALKTAQAAITGVPVKCTIKKLGRNNIIQETPARDLLWEAQTPQGFHKNILLKAHERKTRMEATDDAMLVEQMGTKVKMVMGDYRNVKVTTPEDMVLARHLL